MGPRKTAQQKQDEEAARVADATKAEEALELSRAQSNFAGAMSRAEPGSDQAQILAIYKALPLRSDKKRDIIKKWTEDTKMLLAVLYIRYEH